MVAIPVGEIIGVNLKNKSQLFYQQKWIYSGIVENCNLGQASSGKNNGKSKKQKRGALYFMEEEVKFGNGCSEQTLEKSNISG